MVEIYTGIDMEEVSRFDGLKPEKASYLTKKEKEYCYSHEIPRHHLAGRFVAKEAIIKALCAARLENPRMQDIEILNDDRGVPRVIKPERDISLSISHTKYHAIAIANLVKEK